MIRASTRVYRVQALVADFLQYDKRNLQTRVIFSAFRHYNSSHDRLWNSQLINSSKSCNIDIPKPPRSQIKRDTIHGNQRDDEFAFFSDDKRRDVLAYIEKENSYASKVMAPTKRLQKQLYEEMASRVRPKENSASEKIGNYEYYARVEGASKLPIYCRRSSNGAEEILLDHNELIIGHPYLSVGSIKISHDQRFLAYTVDTVGNEVYSLKVKEIGNNRHFLEEIDSVVSFEWSADGQFLAYTVVDDSFRPYQLYVHKLNTPVSDDILLYDETDPSFFLDITHTKNKRYITINSNSKTTSEVRIIDVDHLNKYAKQKIRLLRPRQDGIEYYVEHRQDTFYIVTNEHATNYKVCKMQDATSDLGSSSEWQTILQQDEDSSIEDMDIFENHLVLYGKHGGAPRIQVYNFSINNTNDALSTIPLPDAIATIEPGANQDFMGKLLRFSTSTLLLPERTYDYDLNNGKLTLVREISVGPFTSISADNSSTTPIIERHSVLSNDGTPVTMTVLRPGNGKPSPCLLHVYGAYGHSLEPSFHNEYLSLLARNWVIVLCHVRGGGEKGRAWYNAARLEKREKGIEDTLAMAKYLRVQSWIDPHNICIRGVSAGAVLVGLSWFGFFEILGASVSRESDLFRTAIMKVPFVDVLTAMLDENLPLTRHEYDEWGNPSKDAHIYESMKKYSPYETIHQMCSSGKRIPSMLLTASLRDNRVPYWHPLKYMGRLRISLAERRNSGINSSESIFILSTCKDSGHFGQGGRYGYLEEAAYEYAFLLMQMKQTTISS